MTEQTTVEFEVGDTVRVEQFLRGKHGDVYEVVTIGYDRLVFGGKSTITGRHCPIMVSHVIEVVPAGTIGEVEPPVIPRAYRPLADLTPTYEQFAWPVHPDMVEARPGRMDLGVWHNPAFDDPWLAEINDRQWDALAAALSRPPLHERWHLRTVAAYTALVAIPIIAAIIDLR